MKVSVSTGRRASGVLDDPPPDAVGDLGGGGLRQFGGVLPVDADPEPRENGLRISSMRWVFPPRRLRLMRRSAGIRGMGGLLAEWVTAILEIGTNEGGGKSRISPRDCRKVHPHSMIRRGAINVVSPREMLACCGMDGMLKSVESLTPEDFARFPVWEYDLDAEGTDGQDETWVRPVEDYPVTDLDNRVIGITVSLQNSSQKLACLSNIAVDNLRSTREFLTLSLWFEGKWVHLARYFDVDHAQSGPVAFASRLGLPVTRVFPITYDISEYTQGLESVLRGMIESEPAQRLTEDERMSLLL